MFVVGLGLLARPKYVGSAAAKEMRGEGSAKRHQGTTHRPSLTQSSIQTVHHSDDGALFQEGRYRYPEGSVLGRVDVGLRTRAQHRCDPAAIEVRVRPDRQESGRDGFCADTKANEVAGKNTGAVGIAVQESAPDGATASEEEIAVTEFVAGDERWISGAGAAEPKATVSRDVRDPHIAG